MNQPISETTAEKLRKIGLEAIGRRFTPAETEQLHAAHGLRLDAIPDEGELTRIEWAGYDLAWVPSRMFYDDALTEVPAEHIVFASRSPSTIDADTSNDASEEWLRTDEDD